MRFFFFICLVFLSVGLRPRWANAAPKIYRLADCAIAVGGNPNDEAVQRLGRLDDLGTTPEALWAGWNGGCENTDLCLSGEESELYFRTYHATIGTFQNRLKSVRTVLALMSVAHARAWESVFHERGLRLRRVTRETASTDEQRAEHERRALVAGLAVLEQGNGLKLYLMEDAMAAQLQAIYTRVIEKVFELQGTQVRKTRYGGKVRPDSVAWEILPVEGGSPWNAAAYKLSQLKPTHGLQYVPAMEFEEQPHTYATDTHVFYLSRESLRAGDPRRFVKLARETFSQHREVGKSVSGLMFSYKSPENRNFLGSAVLLHAHSLSRTGKQMPEDPAEIDRNLGYLANRIIGLKELASELLQIQLGMEGQLFRALGDLAGFGEKGREFFAIAVTEDGSDEFTVGVAQVGGLRGFKIDWRLRVGNPSEHSHGFNFYSQAGILDAALRNSARFTVLGERLLAERKNYSKMVKGADVPFSVRENAWELLALAKRQNEVAIAINRYVLRRVDDATAALELFASHRDTASLELLRDSLVSFDLPNFSNSTIRNLPRLHSEIAQVRDTGPRPASTDQRWFQSKLPLKHQVEELEAAPGLVERRRVVERIGMTSLIRHASGLGWRWKDVSQDNVGYDVKLWDPRTGAELHVELKARSHGEKTVLLSVNELHFAAENPNTAVLAVVWVDAKGNTETTFLQDYVARGTVSPAEISRTLSLERLFQHARLVTLYK